MKLRGFCFEGTETVLYDTIMVNMRHDTSVESQRTLQHRQCTLQYANFLKMKKLGDSRDGMQHVITECNCITNVGNDLAKGGGERC